MNKLLFFTATDNGYEDFIPLYVYFASKYNKDAQFEFLVKNLTPEFQNLINEFSKTFHTEINLRKITSNNIRGVELRFLEEPKIKCEYTYIGDIDIFINEPILDFHISMMKKYSTIYSNCVRYNDKDRMSGLHMVKTKEWYENTKKVRDSYKDKIEFKHFQRSNELLLKDITFESKLSKYVEDSKDIKDFNIKRPVHGLHISLKRVPFTDKMYFPTELFKSMIINDLYKSEDWNKLKPFLSKKILDILKTCEDYCNSLN